MRQVTGLTSTYSSDEFGICSALYELGGMVVMHDASGCNSTYTTHDEPRWYDQDSMIFISAISEAEAIMGDDDKLIADLIETAGELHPKFIALVGAPIPYMIGTDLDAIARIVSEQTGIPCFGFAANGMNHYTRGISMALERIVEFVLGKKNVKDFGENIDADRAVFDVVENGKQQDQTFYSKPFSEEIIEKISDTCDEEKKFVVKDWKSEEKIRMKGNVVVQENSSSNGEHEDGKAHSKLVVNILGATPLDFSLNGSVESMWEWLLSQNMMPGICLSMGCVWEDLWQLENVDVNLVVSYGGLAAARVLEKRCGIPYVIGVPFGTTFSGQLAETLVWAVEMRKSCCAYKRQNSCTDDMIAHEKIALENVLLKHGGIDGENGVFGQSASDDMENNLFVQNNMEESMSDTLGDTIAADLKISRGNKPVLIGESVFCASLAAAIEADTGQAVRVLCPVDTEEMLLRAGDMRTPEEDDVMREIGKADMVIADPLYRPLAHGKTFFDLPHEAFSGRIYDAVNPNLIAKNLSDRKSLFK